MSDDNKDANQLIIESVPLGGMTRRLIDPHQATQIRAKIALALGMEDDELAAKLAHFQHTGAVKASVFVDEPPARNVTR